MGSSSAVYETSIAMSTSHPFCGASSGNVSAADASARLGALHERAGRTLKREFGRTTELRCFSVSISVRYEPSHSFLSSRRMPPCRIPPCRSVTATAAA